MTTKKALLARLDNVRIRLDTTKDYQRSAWNRGVSLYAQELAETLQDWVEENGDDYPVLKRAQFERIILNGADSWQEYSDGGRALIYDPDIAQRLCTPSEYKRTDGGRLNPNSRERWLDCQARALFQANLRLWDCWKEEEKVERLMEVNSKD